MGQFGYNSGDCDVTADTLGSINADIIKRLYNAMQYDRLVHKGTGNVGALLFYLRANDAANATPYERMLLPRKVRDLAIDLLEYDLTHNPCGWVDMEKRRAIATKEIRFIRDYFLANPDFDN